MICGGGETNGLFASEGLIDEVYLDIEPVILSEGTKLFGDYKIKMNLDLLESSKIGSQIVQLHYKVIE